MDTSSYDISTSSTVTPLTNPKLSVFDTFSGYGEMLGIKASYYGSVGYFNSLFYIKTIEKLNTFNEFGQKVREDFLYNTDTISYRTISYKTFTHNQVTYNTDEVENESFHTTLSGTTSLAYSYTRGCITEILKNSVSEHTYTYSMDSKLISDENYSYSYDGVGNVTSIEGKTIGYSSSQKTKAISYNGSSITYLDNGYFYPVSIDGAALSYSDGKLTSHTKNGILTTYAYNMYGLRESKITDGITTEYFYNGNKLISLIHLSYTLYFLYDGDEPFGFIYSNAVYYYMRDITGIIRGIVNTNGSIVVEYSYTSYGRIQSVTGSMSSTIGTYNPIRYKGYFYDEESGYYYCKSRYYVPFLGRWLTPDDPKYLDDKSLCGFNPYAYCNDNPVMYSDEEENFGILACMLMGAGVGLAVGGFSSVITQWISNGRSNINWGLVVSGAVFGAIDGALSVTGMGALASAVIGGALSGIQYCVEQGISGEDFNINGFFLSVGIGAISGAVLPGNFDGYAMSGIYNTSKGYLTSGTLKSAKKIGMYTAKVAFVKKNIIKRSAIYAASSALTSGVQYGADYLFDDILGWI